MKRNQCNTCKHGKSMYATVRGIFYNDQRYYVVCDILSGNEITPVIRDFIATCGCMSYEVGE
jgi:hypothetical protein